MKLLDSFDGNTRFEGDHVSRWRSIPANARIVSAKVTVTPLDANIGIPFGEVLSFDGATGDFGATRASVSAGSAMSWVEVDFHARRTLARAIGSFPSDTNLQVDVGGGTYVEINKVGAFKTPSDTAPQDLFQLSGSPAPLPGLTVVKFKLTKAVAAPPKLDSVIVASVPVNVSLRVGELPPFWTHVGEMTKPETTPDFTAVLQAALISAKVENGFYDLPIIIHSDAIARLNVGLEVEFLVEQKPLPNGLSEVVLPFDYSSVPQSSAATINIEAPPNSRAVPAQTTARVKGAFAETRIAPGRGATGEATPAAEVEVSPACTQAQCIEFTESDDQVAATAIDLLIEATEPAARLRLEIRGDLDGKPDDGSLLPSPAELSIDQQAVKGPHWTSVPLPAEFVFEKPAKGSGKTQRYWLVLQSLVGAAAWSTYKAAPGALNMQCTRDRGHSWRDTTALKGTLRDPAAAPAGPFAAFFRLRESPKTFKVPIELQVGTADKQVRVKLDRFAPLGRVDFSLGAELAQGINQYLKDHFAAACPEIEHLLNPDFEHWEQVGDNLVSRPAIGINSPIRGVAFSPDGSHAYVLDQSKKHFLVVIDAACGQVQQEIPLTISGPRAFVVSPDGTRAYVTNGSGIQIVNLIASQAIAGVFDLQLTSDIESDVNDLAVSPDGARLYAVSLIGDVPKKNAIRVIDIAAMEQQLTTGPKPGNPQKVTTIDADPNQEISPIALTVSPDGNLLHMLIARPGINGIVQSVDTTTFAILVPDIPVLSVPKAMALTQDGERALVVNGATDDLSLIHTAARTSTTIDLRTSTTISLGLSPVDVAVAPDGAFGYVFESDNSINVVDLGRQVVTENFKFIAASTIPVPIPAALALSLQGDQIYAAHNGHSSFVSPIQLGTRRPAEWQITSGVVSPVCLPPPAHLAAILGPAATPSAISQVAPVSASCTYEFSFQGIATESDSDEPPAVAEVLWLGSDCGLLRPPDPVPIKLREAATRDPSPTGTVLFGPDGAPVSLELHRARFTPPAGADQAEVRFTAPSGASAVIDQVSLIATSEATANSDFASEENGRLAGWTLEPALAPGFTVLKGEGETQLRNAGAAPVALIQTVPAQSRQPFTLAIQAKAVVASVSRENQRVELHWLSAAGAPTGSPTIVQIAADGLPSSAGSGTAPDATQAEVRLIVPAGTTLLVKLVSLRFSKPTTLPVTFIAESPGELTVSDLRIAFENVDATAPPVPDRGLCIPTPPGCAPGKGSGDRCHCHQCASEQPIVDTKAVLTAAARPGLTGNCATCGTKLLRLGGPRVVSAESFSISNTSTVTQPRVIHSTIANTEFTVRNAESSSPIPLTELSGIGAARAKQLAEIGIDSVEKLAASTPEVVVRIKFITVEMATRLVSDAKARVEASNQ